MCHQYTLVITVVIVAGVSGHGRLIEPPGRSTMWRFGFDTPQNYDDMGLFCGGSSVQWGQNGGKCGVCGDNFKGPWDNEAGGKYALGIIVRKYDPGQLIDVAVRLTANHKGWFEFRLCKNDDPKFRVTQDCFDKNVLADAAGKKRFEIAQTMELVKLSLLLPVDIHCKDCVLQWKYNTGNSWGVDPITNKGCIGCGPQEQFYGCADVAIGENEVKIGKADQPVNVPAGDMDDRKWKEEKDPCTCAQVSMGLRIQPYSWLAGTVLVVLTYTQLL